MTITPLPQKKQDTPTLSGGTQNKGAGPRGKLGLASMSKHFLLTISKFCILLQVNGTDIFATDYLDLRSGETRYRNYYIAAEEITWDYGVRKPPQLIKPRSE